MDKRVTKRHKIFLNQEEAVAEIVNDLSSSEPKQVKLFADVYPFIVGGKTWSGRYQASADDIEHIGIWYQNDKHEKKIFYKKKEDGICWNGSAFYWKMIEHLQIFGLARGLERKLPDARGYESFRKKISTNAEFTTRNRYIAKNIQNQRSML